MPCVVGYLLHALSQGPYGGLLHGGSSVLSFARTFAVRSLAGNFLVRSLRRFFLAFFCGAFLRAPFRGGFFRALFRSSFLTSRFCKKFCCAFSHKCFYREIFCGAFLTCTVLRGRFLSAPSWGSFPSTFQNWLCACAFL